MLLKGGYNFMLSLLAKHNGETIRQHTDNLLQGLAHFKELYGGYFTETELKAIEIACEYHDYGKAIFSFQKHRNNQAYLQDLKQQGLYEDIEKLYQEIGFLDTALPHGYVSPAFLNIAELKAEFGTEMVKNIVTAIYYHHNRDKEIGAEDLQRILTEDIEKRYGIKLSVKYRKYIAGLRYFLSDDVEQNDRRWISYAVIKGMLNKFDYYASCEDKDKPDIEIQPADAGGYTISDRVPMYFDEQGYDYREIQKYAVAHKNDNVVMIASTGIGKTEAALLWGGNEKLFYTLPLKVSINAMYNRIKGVYNYDKATFLHSETLTLMIKEGIPLYDSRYEATRRLSYPLTVCTVDQLFTFVYKYKGSEILLATLKYAKLVIDEIQTYEPEIIAKIIYGLKLITMAGGKFAIITATFPPIFEYFLRSGKYFNDGKGVMCEHTERFLLEEKRHKIEYIEGTDFDYSYIVSKAESKKILIICNTIKRACEVYSHLRNWGTDVKLLHAHYIKGDRKKLEEQLMLFSNSSASGIWVTTQIVEASLDIDFDMLFTEMCTADSLLQRMGRCYRKREYIDDEANVYVLNNKNGYGTVYNYKEIYDRSVEYLMEYQGKYFTEQDKLKYIDKVYSVEALKDTAYFKAIESQLKGLRNIAVGVLDKQIAKQSFRDIYTYAVVPMELYKEKELQFKQSVSVLLQQGTSSSVKRKARQFIEDNVIHLQVYDKRLKDIKMDMFQGLNYGVVPYKYTFSADGGISLGLTYEQI